MEYLVDTAVFLGALKQRRLYIMRKKITRRTSNGSSSVLQFILVVVCTAYQASASGTCRCDCDGQRAVAICDSVVEAQRLDCSPDTCIRATLVEQDDDLTGKHLENISGRRPPDLGSTFPDARPGHCGTFDLDPATKRPVVRPECRY